MTISRVTPLSMNLRLQQAVRQAQLRRFDASDELSSGKRVSRYSDAPADAASIVRLRAQESDLQTFARNADDATAWLNTQDSALQDANLVLQRVRELTVTASSSIISPTEREAIATELDVLRDRLSGLANTKHLGRSVFGGFGDQAVANVAGTWTFTGDSGAVNRRIAPDIVMQVNVDGAAAFGFASGTDVFSLLDRVAANVRSGDIAATGGADLDDLDARMQDIHQALATVGGRANQVEGVKSSGAAQIDNLRQSRSVIEDADVAEAAMNLSMAELGYEATLAATARVSMTSLLDFLR